MSSYNVSRRRSAQGGFVSAGGVLWVFHMQGIGSFLLHLTAFRSPPVLRPPFFSTRRKLALPISRSILFVFFIYGALSTSSHLPFPHPSLRIIPRLACFLPVFLFLLFSSHISLYLSVFFTMHTFILFITPSYWFCYWLCCCLVLLILIFLFSFFL